MSPKGLRVAVIADWSLCSRGNHWHELFEHNRLNNHECIERRIADSVVPRDDETKTAAGYSFLEELNDLDVVIVNWDAVNGDPEFGADFTFRWFEHHRGEVLLWVKGGGLLIIEGQAILGVPSQRAYDALLGAGEVAVCGPEDELEPRAQEARFGSECYIASAAKAPHAFASAMDKLTPRRQVTHEDMFPGMAAPRVAGFLAQEQWNLLYRGWFRRSLRRRSRLTWMPAIVTKRKGGRTHPTCLIARHGKGGIIATTMFLASSGQERLVEALLSCHGNVDALPAPTGLSWLLSDKFAPPAISVTAGTLASVTFPTQNWEARLAFLLAVTVTTFLLLQLVLPRWGWRVRRRLRVFLGW